LWHFGRRRVRRFGYSLLTGIGKARVPKIFYELEEAALLGVSSGELEMVAHEELSLVKVGSRRRLVRVREVEAALARVKAGGRLRTKREFRGESVEDAMRRAAGVFGVAPESLTYRVLERGNPWAPGLKASEARVLVDLSEGSEPGGSDGTAPPGGNGERRPGLRAERSVPGVPAADGEIGKGPWVITTRRSRRRGSLSKTSTRSTCASTAKSSRLWTSRVSLPP
jgi:hypothetical protein